MNPRPSSMKYRWVALPAILLLTILSARAMDSAESAYFPWKKGATWTYAGTVTWMENGKEKNAPITYPITVTDTYESSSLRAARLDGFVFDLTDAGRNRSAVVLVQVGSNHVFLFEEGVDEIWKTLCTGSANTYFKALLGATPLMEFPLTVDARWGDQANTPRGWYCYLVKEENSFTPSSVKGAPKQASHHEFVMTERTNPSTVSFSFVPGLGITGFQYEHHGTPAAADVHLVQYRP